MRIPLSATAGLIVALLCAGGPVQGARVPDLYGARVPVSEAGTAGLDEAFARALSDVLIKVSGRRTVGAGGLTAEPGALVRQYQPLAGGFIKVQFDPAAVRNRLDQAGLPVWGSERPTTMVWLKPAGESAAGESPWRQAALETATIRGVPLLWPSPGAASPSAGELPAVLARSAAGGGVEAVLLGQATSPAGDSWRWTLLTQSAAGDRDQQEWQGDIAGGIHGLADRLAARFAGTVTALQQFSVLITEVRDFAAYGRLQQAFQSVEDVEGAEIQRLQGDRIAYRVTIRGDAERLRETLLRGGFLAPQDPGSTDLVFRMVAGPP